MAPPTRVIVGAERMGAYLPLLEGKQVALVVNGTSRIGNTHLLDTLWQSGVCISRIFAPEHGFRGGEEAGADVSDEVDEVTGVPVVSLYGKKKKPSAEDLQQVDVLIFDIQDVGARFYTYISTLFRLLEAAADNDKMVIVLDRPNPNGHLIDGPLLESGLESFVGIAPMPIAHGCTVGEMARYFTGEWWIWRERPPVKLKVITCLNYTHRTPYDLPVRPSPNLPNMRAILLYPSLCLFEGTTVSVGRGTDWPFQWVGHPDFPQEAANTQFTPCTNEGSKNPIQENRLCRGYDLRETSLENLRRREQLDLHWLLDFYAEFPDKDHFFRKDGYFDMLAGTKEFRQFMELGTSEEDIRASWEDGLRYFRLVRKTYLLYPD